MIKKMAKILLPWFILAYLPNLSARILSIYAGQLGTNALASLSMGSMILQSPISIFIVLSLLGLVISAIKQEKGNPQAGLGIHIGFTCAAMGLMMSYYTAVILFPNQLIMMQGASDDMMIAYGAAYLRAVGLTIILLMTAFMLIGQLMMKKPSLKATLIVAGVMFAHIWVGFLMISLYPGDVTNLGIIQGIQIATRTILPFAFIPMRSYWRTFGPEENILPAAAAIETAEAAAE